MSNVVNRTGPHVDNLINAIATEQSTVKPHSTYLEVGVIETRPRL